MTVKVKIPFCSLSLPTVNSPLCSLRNLRPSVNRQAGFYGKHNLLLFSFKLKCSQKPQIADMHSATRTFPSPIYSANDFSAAIRCQAPFKTTESTLNN